MLLSKTMPRSLGLFLVLCLLILAGIPRVLSLNAHWSSDEARWLRRSVQFMSAVKRGAFSDTLIAHHPGVMTMWVAGFRTFFIEPGVDVKNLTGARWFIGILVWVGIGVACLLLCRLFGRWVALTSFACLVYSPLFLAQTRRVHTDALATTFILLTVLLFLVYCRNRQHRRHLILSGVAFGLALLSKSYALILLLWMPLCLFLFQEKREGHFLERITELLCFLNCTALTVLVLWPVFWNPVFAVMALSLLTLTLVLVNRMKKERCSLVLISAAFAVLVLLCVRAIQTAWLVFHKINWSVTTPHEVEHFFLGKVVNEPGWLFYPFVLTIKSTPLLLPLSLLGYLLLWKQRKNTAETERQFRTALVLVIGVVLFTLCLSATSKKFSRYLLPAFPLLEILAAIGFVETLQWCYTALHSRFGNQATTLKHTFTAVVFFSFFLIQVLPVLILHPYYGTYYNLCWKLTDITKIITMGEASGLDITANYLNEKPDARELVVQVSPLATEFVYRYFRGRAYRADRGIRMSPNYEVVYIRDSQIGRVPETGTLNGELEATITLNGIEHVWIYRIPSSKE